MAYSLVHENPLINQEHDIVVAYDINQEQFLVAYTESSSGYIVNRGELVNDTSKYFSEVMDKILSDLPDTEDFLVLVTNIAQNSINLVCEANRLLY